MDPARFDMEEILSCMRCGFCLPTCPTYVHTGNEAASPRGRIALMRGAAEGVIPLAHIADQMDACLGCLNCVTACPADVQFGRLLEDAREALASPGPSAPVTPAAGTPAGAPAAVGSRAPGAPAPWTPAAPPKPPPDAGPARRISRLRRFTEGLAFRWVLVSRWMPALLRGLLWIYQRSGLGWAVRRLGLLGAAPGHIRDMEKALPRVPPPWRSRHPRVTPARRQRRLKVGYFTGCVMDALFQPTNAAAIKLLAASGCEVHVTPGQRCCGALHAHSGRKGTARDLATDNIAAFEPAGFDYVVNSAGGCGAAMKEYGHWLRDDPRWAPRAADFSSRVRDLSEVLEEMGLPAPVQKAAGRSGPTNAAPGESENGRRITFQHSCHLIHGQKVVHQPRRLIQQLPGAIYCEMAEADRCCGSAGIYNLTHPDLSMEILDAKMKNVDATGAGILITANPGCLLQMRMGVERAGLGERMRVVHLADLLEESLL